MDARGKQSFSKAVMIFQNVIPDRDRFDTSAELKVFLNHWDFIRRIICFHIHDEDQADDFFQDFFLSFVSHALPRDIQNIKSYLYKAITNDIIDSTHQKENYYDCIHEYGRLSNHSDNQQTPSEIVMRMEETRKVFELIEKRLNRTEAQAVLLKYKDGSNTKDIANRMGVGTSTVRGYVSDGLKKIRGLAAKQEK